MKRIVLISFCSLFFGCINDLKKQKEENEKDIIPVFLTGLDVEPLLKKADSVQVLFYLDPFGKDSVRYTRYFKYHNTSDTAVINGILTNFSTTNFLPKNEKLACRSQGKIHFFNRDQELKTVYFNITNDKDCSYLYFIKDGMFYYFQSAERVKTTLTKLQKIAQ